MWKKIVVAVLLLTGSAQAQNVKIGGVDPNVEKQAIAEITSQIVQQYGHSVALMQEKINEQASVASAQKDRANNLQQWLDVVWSAYVASWPK